MGGANIRESSLEYLLANLCLNVINSIPQLLSDGLAFERVYIEAVSLGGEDKEGYHCHITLAGLEVMVESSQCLNEEISSLVRELVSKEEITSAGQTVILTSQL